MNKPRILITLKKSQDSTWTAKDAELSPVPAQSQPGQASGIQSTSQSKNEADTAIPNVARVAENVSSFFSGIRASFRNENVNVAENFRQRSGKESQN